MRMETHAVNTDVPALARLQHWALVVGFWGLLGGAIGWFLNPDQFYRSWLIGVLFCLGLSLGSLALLMLQHMSGGQWGLVGRRVFEAASRNVPLVALLFVPLLFGLPRLYAWARPDEVRVDQLPLLPQIACASIAQRAYRVDRVTRLENTHRKVGRELVHPEGHAVVEAVNGAASSAGTNRGNDCLFDPRSFDLDVHRGVFGNRGQELVHAAPIGV